MKTLLASCLVCFCNLGADLPPMYCDSPLGIYDRLGMVERYMDYLEASFIEMAAEKRLNTYEMEGYGELISDIRYQLGLPLNKVLYPKS